MGGEREGKEETDEGRKRVQGKEEKEGGRIGENSKKGGAWEKKKEWERGNGKMEGGKVIIPHR